MDGYDWSGFDLRKAIEEADPDLKSAYDQRYTEFDAARVGNDRTKFEAAREALEDIEAKIAARATLRPKA